MLDGKRRPLTLRSDTAGFSAQFPGSNFCSFRGRTKEVFSSKTFRIYLTFLDLKALPSTIQLCINFTKFVILLHSLHWSVHTKDASKRGTAFAFIFGVNWLWRCGVTASFGVFFHEIKCNGVTSFMEFMEGERGRDSRVVEKYTHNWRLLWMLHEAVRWQNYHSITYHRPHELEDIQLPPCTPPLLPFRLFSGWF